MEKELGPSLGTKLAKSWVQNFFKFWLISAALTLTMYLYRYFSCPIIYLLQCWWFYRNNCRIPMKYSSLSIVFKFTLTFAFGRHSYQTPKDTKYVAYQHNLKHSRLWMVYPNAVQSWSVTWKTICNLSQYKTKPKDQRQWQQEFSCACQVGYKHTLEITMSNYLCLLFKHG